MLPHRTVAVDQEEHQLDQQPTVMQPYRANYLQEVDEEDQRPNANAYFTKKTVISGLMNIGLVNTVGPVWRKNPQKECQQNPRL